MSNEMPKKGREINTAEAVAAAEKVFEVLGYKVISTPTLASDGIYFEVENNGKMFMVDELGERASEDLPGASGYCMRQTPKDGKTWFEVVK